MVTRRSLTFATALLATAIAALQGEAVSGGEGPESGVSEGAALEFAETESAFLISTSNYRMSIQREGFRFAIHSSDGETILPAHPESGIRLSSGNGELSDVASVTLSQVNRRDVTFETVTTNGIDAVVTVEAGLHELMMRIEPKDDATYTILARTSGLTPAFGLGEDAMLGEGAERRGGITTDVTGFETPPRRVNRMVSNFVIFPRHGLAAVNIEPGQKIVRVTESELVQGAEGVRSMPALYYFVGPPRQIYRSFLEVRNREGFPVYRPKYEMFGIGWEAFGALAWRTSQEAVIQEVQKYLDLGFPLDWIVIGSGFWPRGDDEFDEHGLPVPGGSRDEEARKLAATTSFGMWDERLYPDPRGMIDYLRAQGLNVILGLRIGFIPGGPFTQEGLNNGYFLRDEEGEARLIQVGFPTSEVYLLDARNAAAVDWYLELADRWLAYGVTGFKEDLYGYPEDLPNDLVDSVNRALMDAGVFVIGRNNYLGSPVDLHRMQGLYYNRNQDRGPVNGMAFAYSGFPFVYPDMVGGTGLGTRRFGSEPAERLRMYVMRYAQYAALNPAMAFGHGPWNFDDEVVEVTRNAALLHRRLQPFIYSNAVRASKTGFPFVMTPLPLAYPDDPEVYTLENDGRRGYQWLIGDALLATPLYGEDYATAEPRDVYLPAGTWIEYDSGVVHEGPVTLEDFPLPVGKTPLFVGGNGILVERRNDEFVARVYPVGKEGELVFYGENGQPRNRIVVSNPDWENPVAVEKDTGSNVSGEWVRHAFEFPLNEETDYIVR